MATQRKRRGSWVRLKKPTRSGPQKARIIEEQPGIAKGAVLLSHALGGMYWWNKSDLVVCDPPAGLAR